MLEGVEQLGRNAVRLRPGVREALDALGVGILRRREAALGQPELAEHVLERLLRNLAVALVAGHQPAVQVRGSEQCVVIQHLLEVRDEPFAVDRIPVEAASEQVVHPAQAHRIERLRRQLHLAPAQQKLEHGGGRELRRIPETAPDRIELSAKPAHGLGQQRRRERLV